MFVLIICVVTEAGKEQLHVNCRQTKIFSTHQKLQGCHEN